MAEQSTEVDLDSVIDRLLEGEYNIRCFSERMLNPPYHRQSEVTDQVNQ
jgi:hypothetical protein